MRDVSRNSRVTWRVVWQMSSTWHGADNVGKYASFLSCYLLPVCATSCITLDMIISVVELIISPTNTRILYYKLQTNLRFTDFLCLNSNGDKMHPSVWLLAPGQPRVEAVQLLWKWHCTTTTTSQLLPWCFRIFTRLQDNE